MRGYTQASLCRFLGLTPARLRTCLRAALLPGPHSSLPRRYSFQDLLLLRRTKVLTEAGVPATHIRSAIKQLRSEHGDREPVTRFRFDSWRKRLVVWDGGVGWQPQSGQIILSFPAVPSTVRQAKRRQASSAACSPAERGLTAGQSLDDEAPEAARQAYDEALRLQPTWSDGHVALGVLHHRAGRLSEAEACLRTALRYEPTSSIAHYHLALVLDALDRPEEAITALQAAVNLAPDDWEAHCTLAKLYERLGRTRDAFRHYAAAWRLQR